jgi:hypothetical protein
MDLTWKTVVASLNQDLAASESVTTCSARSKRALRTALNWLSRQANWSCLHTSTEASALSSGSDSIDYPDNFKQEDEIILNDGTYDGEPLKKLKGGYNRYRKLRKDETTGSYDEPEEYVKRQNKFYLYPVADGAYTPTIYYWRYHPIDDADIITDDPALLFTEEFEDCLNSAFIAAYLDTKKQYQRARFYFLKAQQLADELKLNLSDKKFKRVRRRGER